MDSKTKTIAKLSPDYRNPREDELLESFVLFLEAIGGVEQLVISDAMIMGDIEYAAARCACFEADLVRQVSSRSRRMILLKRAKREVLRRYFQEYIEAIAQRKSEIDALDADEKAELSDVETVEWDLANYLPDFVGRPAAFKRQHAWLLSADNRFFGKPLSPYDIRYWSKQLLAAAGLTAYSVVYFVSLDNAAKVKIGFTTGFAHRLRAFRTASPVEPTVHLTMPGDRKLEDRLHERFRADQIDREWFHFSPAIKAFIAENDQTPKL